MDAQFPKMFREAAQYGLREQELIDLGSDFRINLYRNVAVVDGKARKTVYVAGKNFPDESPY